MFIASDILLACALKERNVGLPCSIRPFAHFAPRGAVYFHDFIAINISLLWSESNLRSKVMSETHLPITCPSCQAVNDQLEVFCRECGTPLVRPAHFASPDVVQAQPVRPKARPRRPRLVVVLGLWLLGFPILVLNVIPVLMVVANPDYRNRSTFMPFWLGVAIVCLIVFALYRVTKNYLTIPMWPPDGEASDGEGGD